MKKVIIASAIAASILLTACVHRQTYVYNTVPNICTVKNSHGKTWQRTGYKACKRALDACRWAPKRHHPRKGCHVI